MFVLPPAGVQRILQLLAAGNGASRALSVKKTKKKRKHLKTTCSDRDSSGGGAGRSVTSADDLELPGPRSEKRPARRISAATRATTERRKVKRASGGGLTAERGPWEGPAG